MSEHQVEDTSPLHLEEPAQPDTVQPSPKPKRWRWILLGLLLVIILGVAGAFLGYQVAVQARLQRESDQIALLTTTQFQLGVQDLEAKRYHTARERFEYVIGLDSKFPGVQEKLAETMLGLAMMASPTVAVTPTIEFTPTPDTRGAEELFNTAQQYMREKNWAAAFDALEALRTEDSSFRSIEVDGLYYIVLRYRGVDKITLEGNLEGGMYDLALTERFGPLDKEADSYRTWARLYLTGASFWGVDWTRVVEAFSQIYPSLPNLRDGSGYTAAERFRLASIHYGDQLAAAEDFCGARDQYNNALSIAQDNNLAPTATAVQLICSPPTATPAPTTVLPTAVPTEEITPIIVETAVPTETKTP